MHLYRSLTSDKSQAWLLHFFFINLIAIYLISFHYLYNAFPLKLYEFYQGDFHLVSASKQLIAAIYLVLTYLSFFALLVSMALLGPWVLSIFFKSAGVIIAASILCASSLIIILLIDAYVFSIYQFHLNATIFEMLWSPAQQEIFYFSPQEWLFLFIGILSIVFAEIGLAALIWGFNWLFFSQWIVRSIIISFILILLSFFSATLLNRNLLQLSDIFPFYSEINRLFFLIPQDKSNLFARNHYYPYQTNSGFMQLRYPIDPVQCTNEKTPLNVFIILIDTWRFDAMNKTITPNIAKLAAENLYFKKHFSGGNATKPGVFSLFYGLPITYWQSMLEHQLSPELIKQFIKKNYQFGVFGSASLSIPNFAGTIFNLIPNLPRATPGHASYDRDQAVTNRFLQFIKKRNPKQPIFSFIFYDGAHAYCEVHNFSGPFQPALETCNHFVLHQNHDVEKLFNRYLNSVYSVDQEIAKTLNAIKKANLWEKSIIIITADHGEEFNDNHLNYWGHTSNFTKYQTQVPLIIHWPGKGHHDYQYTTTHFDIAPTLLNGVLDCPKSFADYSYGTDLFFNTNRYPRIVSNNYEIGYITKDYITTLFTSGHFMIQDLKGQVVSNKTPDPQELSKILSQLNRFKSA